MHSFLPSSSSMSTVAMNSVPSKRPLLGDGNVNNAVKSSVPSNTASLAIVIGKLTQVVPIGKVRTSVSA